MTSHKGSCHCGGIAFRVETEISEAVECNCSICSRKGSLLHFVGADAFTLETPRENLGTYRFNRHVIDHHFCPVCGVSPFAEGKNGDTPMVAINVRCVEGVDPQGLKIKSVDGRSF